MRYLSWFSRPTVPVQYSNGHYGFVDGSLKDNEMMKNPVQYMNLGYRKDESWRFNGKAYAGIDIIDGLSFKSSFAYAFYLNAIKTYKPKDLGRYDAEGNELKIPGQTITYRIITGENPLGRTRISLLIPKIRST